MLGWEQTVDKLSVTGSDCEPTLLTIYQCCNGAILRLSRRDLAVTRSTPSACATLSLLSSCRMVELTFAGRLLPGGLAWRSDDDFMALPACWEASPARSWAWRCPCGGQLSAPSGHSLGNSVYDHRQKNGLRTLLIRPSRRRSPGRPDSRKVFRAVERPRRLVQVREVFVGELRQCRGPIDDRLVLARKNC